MAIETEKKYRLSGAQFEYIRVKLEELDAEFIGQNFEENTIYSGEALRAINAILRIRKVNDKTTFTYKKRLQSNSGIKEQIEHETIIEDASEMQNIIESLGYEKTLIYEKHRQVWNFRQVEIVLDELPFGLFMEIEGAVLAIKEAEMLLGADEFETENKSYPHLTSEFGKPFENYIEARFRLDKN